MQPQKGSSPGQKKPEQQDIKKKTDKPEPKNSPKTKK